jgi:hypothetical protein
MAEDHPTQPTPPSPAHPPRVPLPAGYRQGIITAITVLIGFSLLFFRYWDFETTGEWTISAIIATYLMAISILLQFVSLWRSLQIKDDETEYAQTLRWFLASTLTLLASLAIAGLSMSRIVTF